MATTKKPAAARRRGMSWELMGMFAVVAVVLVAILIWVANPGKAAEIAAPDFSSLTPAGEALTESNATLAMPNGMTPDHHPYLGKPDAKVSVYEYADFQCPHCKAYTTTESHEIKRDYVATNKAKIIFMNFPLPDKDPTKIDESYLAAQAALCAGEQGKFWEMHDWIFANQPEVRNSGAFSVERLGKIADKLGLTREAYDTCMTNEEMAARVVADREAGLKASVNSTPSFIIDTAKVEGGDVAGIRKAIDTAFLK